jgi:hypothetical protein
MAENTEGSGETRHRAGLFDIRFIIAALIGIYGVILFLVAFFTTDAQKAKADGMNINLWAGIGMMVVSGLFILWSQLRPIVVPEEPKNDEAAERPAH